MSSTARTTRSGSSCSRRTTGRRWSGRLGCFGSAARLAFLNLGREAGASRAHEHSHLLGLNVVPPLLQRERDATASSECVVCSLAVCETGVERIEKITVVAHHVPAVPQKTLELSLREALQLGHKYIGTEHLLLALLRQSDSTAGHVLDADLGLDPKRARKATIDTMKRVAARTQAVGTSTVAAVADFARTLQQAMDTIAARLDAIERRLPPEAASG